MRNKLLQMIKDKCWKTGKFTLASGKESDYYINLKSILMNGEAAALIAELMWEKTVSLNIDAVGGMEHAAIPIATAYAYRAFIMHKTVEGFFVRKERKGYGTQSLIEGNLIPGSNVLIVDDVITTGESTEKAMIEVEKASGVIKAVICIVDRNDGGRERLLGKSFLYYPLFTIEDFIG